ncbi:MAG: hypothetical protein FWH02_05825 [Oscillospiraceae bacterium]|nr:hypothetical protein [Oscillospiraceae bacterium]
MRYMTGTGASGPMFTVAHVTYSDSTGFGALGESEKRGLPVFGPRGISWSPCEGDRVLLMRENGADICLGVLSPDGLAPGEIMASTPGGAVLHLKANGEIRLNDMVIPPPQKGGS